MNEDPSRLEQLNGVEETTSKRIKVRDVELVEDNPLAMLDKDDSPDPESPSLVDSGSEKSNDGEGEQQTSNGHDFKKDDKNEELDLSIYYLSDEDEEDSSDDAYNPWDAIEYETETALQRELSDPDHHGLEAGHSEEEIISEMLRRRYVKDRQYHRQCYKVEDFEHDQFDLESVKAIWMDQLDTSYVIPGFTMIVTSHEDPRLYHYLCRA